MRLPMRKILLGALVLAGIGAAGYQLSRPELVPVDMAVIEAGELEVTINADGMTRIKDVFEVSAPVSGQVLRSPVRIGDSVTGGKPGGADRARRARLPRRARPQAGRGGGGAGAGRAGAVGGQPARRRGRHEQRPAPV